MDDLLGRTAAFHSAYGVEPVDVRKRAEAVTAVTRLADVCWQQAEELVQTLCGLISDLETAASDEVLLTGFERTGRTIAQLMLDLYGAAHLLGIDAVDQLVENAHASRMSALSGEGYRPVTAVGLVALPGA